MVKPPGLPGFPGLLGSKGDNRDTEATWAKGDTGDPISGIGKYHYHNSLFNHDQISID